MRAFAIYERGLCDCGFHMSLTEDRSNYFAIEERRCPVCASAAKYGRIQQDADDRAKKAQGENPPPGSPQPGDGRTTYLRRMSPVEVAEKRARRAATTTTTTRVEVNRGNSS